MTANEERKQRAFNTLTHYKGNELREGGDLVDIETAEDLLADIFHAFGETAVDEALATARRNYLIEVKDDAPTIG